MGAGRSPDVVIAGGGIIGCAVAWEVARAGLRVVLVEKDRIGAEASSAAAGMLAPQSEATRPGPFVDLCCAGRDLHGPLAAELLDLVGVDVGYRKTGILRPYFTAEEEAEARQMTAWQRAAGLTVEEIGAEGVRKREPLLAPTVRGALYFAGDHQVDNGKLTGALAQAASLSGVEFRLGEPVLRFLTTGQKVTGVETPAGKIPAGVVVLAAGAWSGEVALSTGMTVPTSPAKGQMLLLHTFPSPLTHIVFASGVYLVPRPEGQIIVGSTVEFVGYDRRVTVAGVRGLLEAATRVAPSLAGQSFVRAWAGFRPVTPDRLPLLGSVPGWRGVLLATGHFRNGILLGPLTGRVVRELIMEGETAYPIKPFGIERFEGSAVSPEERKA